MGLEAIKYGNRQLQLLDQRLLPLELVYLDIKDTQDGWQAIRDMVVRGAPAIAIAAALALAVELNSKVLQGKELTDLPSLQDYLIDRLEYLKTSRPTAVNVFIQMDHLAALTKTLISAADATVESVTQAIIQECEKMMEVDISANKAMGKHGAEAMLKATGNSNTTKKLRVLTHCNTGALATAGYGTALGVIRALHEQGRLEHAYCCETRPYNQGSRLTAFELVYDKIPSTLIVDSAAAALMAQGKIDAVVVGADRVAANGDTANKIGTYSHAVNALHCGIPFFIAAPTTTLDISLPTGSYITIEERSPEEITHFKGAQVAAPGINVSNAAFDVTPGDILAGIITEIGTIYKDKKTEVVNVTEFLQKHQPISVENGIAKQWKVKIPLGFKPLEVETVQDYLRSKPELVEILGDDDNWSIREVGDGNINFVYIVESQKGGLCVKQALPFVRLVGESWPLTLERMRIEANTLVEHHKHCPGHVPKVHIYDERMAITVMDYIPPPNIIIRQGMIGGQIYPSLVEHATDYMAKVLFGTSLIALSTSQFRKQMVKFVNDEMCELTEQVIFTEPYGQADNNRWIAQLDDAVKDVQSNIELKAAATELKVRFMQCPQALLHGDLHTGSIMGSANESYFIDTEFGFYGPIGFDVGKLMGNFLLAYLSCDGHQAEGQDLKLQRRWDFDSFSKLWTGFSGKFLSLWNQQRVGSGGVNSSILFGEASQNGTESMKHYQEKFMRGVFEDTIGFAGTSMIRRTIGIAKVADMESIKDDEIRATCQKRALKIGAMLICDRKNFKNIEEVAAKVETLREDGQQPFYPL
eukprot:TRINITY_DN3645_c0_g7_i1.p1 TRINITY_DN3645_c0_g7~~TRINITY_DN3645_c0_g7_i1.p1  ORF type:complete len:822 (+),score=91.97 TRINITY_DN3645_c0_g7_i1:29-2467(+)